MTIIAISGQKGGSGRSSSTFAIGAALVESGHKVLMVDCDPQASLTAAAGVNAAGESLAEVMGGAIAGQLSAQQVLYELAPGLDLLPSDIALASVELSLVSRMGRENVLKQELTAVFRAYDVVLLDCPPSLGLMTINALVAARGVVVPLKPESNDVRALRLFIDTLKTVQEQLNPDVELIGILPTMHDARLVHHQDAIGILQDAGFPLFSETIARSVKVPEAAAGYQSIVTYDPNHKISAAYRQVALEISSWLKRKHG